MVGRRGADMEGKKWTYMSMREEDGSSEIQYVSYPLHASATNDNLWYTFGTDHLSPLSTTVHALGLTMNVAKSSSEREKEAQLILD